MMEVLLEQLECFEGSGNLLLERLPLNGFIIRWETLLFRDAGRKKEPEKDFRFLNAIYFSQPFSL